LYATSYAERNWFVVPIHGVRDDHTCTCYRRERCHSPGKHPFARLAPSGVLDASRYVPTVSFWYEACPWMNIGIALGASGLVVVDVDPRNGGHETLAEVLAVHGPLPETLTVKTGGGGEHYYFLDPDRQYSSYLIGPGLEIKAGNALVVAPPSDHKSGTPYRWVDYDTPISHPPEWIVAKDQPC